MMTTCWLVTKFLFDGVLSLGIRSHVTERGFAPTSQRTNVMNGIKRLKEVHGHENRRESCSVKKGVQLPATSFGSASRIA
jgi:hypothetical protein